MPCKCITIAININAYFPNYFDENIIIHLQWPGHQECHRKKLLTWQLPMCKMFAKTTNKT